MFDILASLRRGGSIIPSCDPAEPKEGLIPDTNARGNGGQQCNSFLPPLNTPKPIRCLGSSLDFAR